MAGTKEGGRKAAAKNIARDPQHYAKIGAKGGRNGRTGGFAANHELASRAGRIGGLKSRRRKQVNKEDVNEPGETTVSSEHAEGTA